MEVCLHDRQIAKLVQRTYSGSPENLQMLQGLGCKGVGHRLLVPLFSRVSHMDLKNRLVLSMPLNPRSSTLNCWKRVEVCRVLKFLKRGPENPPQDSQCPRFRVF